MVTFGATVSATQTDLVALRVVLFVRSNTVSATLVGAGPSLVGEQVDLRTLRAGRFDAIPRVQRIDQADMQRLGSKGHVRVDANLPEKRGSCSFAVLFEIDGETDGLAR